MSSQVYLSIFPFYQAYCSILYMKPRMQIILRGKKVETLGIIDTLKKVCKDSYKPTCLPSHVSFCTIIEHKNVKVCQIMHKYELFIK